MESLYRKYRPLTFESVVGQQHIVSTLKHAVADGRLSHAYLFCGPRGTGKTTMARILAKALLCERSEAARAEGASGCMACGTCPECQAIAEGTHPDVYELDAASRTGVDNVREEIINSVSFAPVRGAYKVYIIDEVHMLTTAAFNALLKTLEEPPAHVVFVLCTTDPQKLLETILSRCQRFDFHRISNEEIVGRMRYICEQEGFACDDEALELVARHARGGMRDALSTLEQLSVFGGGAVRTADARALLGEVASTVLADFAEKIAQRDTPGLFGLVREQAEAGNDLMELTRDLVGHLRDVYTAAIAGPRAELFDGTPEEVQAFVEEARAFGEADRLARALTVLDGAALEMRNASDPRLVLEIACTRLARPESDLTLEALAERVARLEAQLAAGVPSAPANVAQLVGGAARPGGVAGAPAGGVSAGAAGAVGAPAAQTGAAAAGGVATSGAATVHGAATATAAGPVHMAGGAADVPAQSGRGVAVGVAGGPKSQAAGVKPWERASATAGAQAAPTPAPAGAAASVGASSAMPVQQRGASAAAAGAASMVARADATAPAATGVAGAPAVPARESAGMPAPAPLGASAPATAQASPSMYNGDVAPRQAAAAASSSAAGVPSAGSTAATSMTSAPVPASTSSTSVTSEAAPDPAPAPSKAAVSETPANPSAPMFAETPAVSDAGELQRKWAEVVKHVAAAQPSRGALLQSARAQHDDGAQLTVAFPKGSAFALKMIGRPDSQAIVLPIVCEVFGQRAVSFVMDGGDTPAPAHAPAPGAGESRAAAATPAPGATASRGVPSSGATPAAVSAAAAGGGSQSAAIVSDAVTSRDMTGARPDVSPAQAGTAPSSRGGVTGADASVAAGASPVAAVPGAAPSVSAAAALEAGAAASASKSAAVPQTAAARHVDVDQVSGPTIVPEPDIDAQRKAWEDEQVPYDDATIAAYADDDEVPPFDVPAASSPAASADAAVPAPAANPGAASSAAPSGTPCDAAPQAPAPWATQDDPVEGIPQTPEEAKELLNSIFGAGVVIKPAE